MRRGGVDPNFSSFATSRFHRTPLATAALLAILTLHSAHALPTSSDGTTTTLDLSSSIAEQFPEPLDPGLQYDQTYAGTEVDKGKLNSIYRIDLPAANSQHLFSDSLAAQTISADSSAIKLKVTSMDGIKGFLFANYADFNSTNVVANGGLLHIQLNNSSDGSQPFVYEGVDFKTLNPLSNVATVALHSSNGANDNQLYIQDSAITLQTEGKKGRGWQASAVNIANITGDVTRNIAVIDNSQILYDEGTDQYSDTRIRLGAVNLTKVNKEISVSDNQLWVTDSVLDINSLYAVSIYYSGYGKTKADNNTVYVTDSLLTLNPYVDPNVRDAHEGIYAVASATEANGNWLEITNSSLTVLNCEDPTIQYIETVKGAKSAQGNTLIVRNSDITSKSTIYFSAATVNHSQGADFANGNSVFIGSTDKDNQMTITHEQDGTLTFVYGGRVYSTDSGKTVQANTNQISIENLNINNNAQIIGGYIWGNGSNGDASGNQLTISNSIFSGDATGGTVFAGGYASVTGTATNNTVSISNSKLADGVVIYGGYVGSASNAALPDSISSVTNNSVIIGENVTDLNGGRWKAAGILGWNGLLATGSNSFTTASSFDVEEFGGFQHYSFILNEHSFDSGAVINVTGSLPVYFQPDGDEHSTVAIGGSNLNLTAGKQYTLIQSAAGFKDNDNADIVAGKLSDDVKGQLTITSVESLARVEKSTLSKDDYDLSIVDGTGNEQSLVMEVTGLPVSSTSVNDQTDTLIESSLSALATAFAADDLFVDSVLRSRDGKRDGLFAAARAGMYSYDTNTRLETNIVNGLVGFSASLGQSNVGAFLEMGHASYDSRLNSTLGNVRGQGSHNYAGVGVFVDYALPVEGWRLTGYVKGGSLHNDFNAMIVGVDAGYDKSSAYWGAHLGTHYDIDMPGLTTRVFFSYFYDGRESESYEIGGTADIGGAHIEYDALNAHRVQAGSIFQFKMSDRLRPYLGLTFEQILAAEAKGTATDAAGKLDLRSSDLEGSTGILSAGWTYMNEPGTFSCEFGLNGYAGTRNGVSGQIQGTWKF